jgi:hypothetical protein
MPETIKHPLTGEPQLVRTRALKHVDGTFVLEGQVSILETFDGLEFDMCRISSTTKTSPLFSFMNRALALPAGQLHAPTITNCL